LARHRAPVKDPVKKYARDVLAGRIVAGHPVRLACERHLRDVNRAKKERGPNALNWRLDRALAVMDFFAEILVLEDGSPFVLEPFQEFILGSICGWYKGDSRRYHTAYVEAGKGSGKTPMAAGLAVYGLVADGEPAPEVYAAAVDRDQAGIAFKDAKRFVEASPELSALVEVMMTSLSIPKKNATFMPLSAEQASNSGRRVHVGIVDELHEHPSATLVDKLGAGIKRRKNALIFEITNSGHDRTSVCWQHHEYSLQVLQGVVDNDTWFAYVCALDDGDRWVDERVWLKANPGLGKILPVEYLRGQVDLAKGMPAKENIVRRLNFCEWTEQADRAIGMDAWDKGDAPVVESELEGRECFGGLDLAATDDLASFALLFGPDDQGFLDAIVRFWIPEESIEAGPKKRPEHLRLQLLEWVKRGLIYTTPGSEIDQAFIERQVKEDCARFRVRQIGYDRWNAQVCVTNLQDAFGDGDDALTKMVEHGQGYADMSAPTKDLLSIVRAGKLRHGGNQVLRWQASNLAIEEDAAGNIKPNKKRSGEKIDGIVALIMADGRRSRTGKAKEPEDEFYDDGGRGLAIIGDDEPKAAQPEGPSAQDA